MHIHLFATAAQQPPIRRTHHIPVGENLPIFEELVKQ